MENDSYYSSLPARQKVNVTYVLEFLRVESRLEGNFASRIPRLRRHNEWKWKDIVINTKYWHFNSIRTFSLPTCNSKVMWIVEKKSDPLRTILSVLLAKSMPSSSSWTKRGLPRCFFSPSRYRAIDPRSLYTRVAYYSPANLIESFSECIIEYPWRSCAVISTALSILIQYTNTRNTLNSKSSTCDICK